MAWAIALLLLATPVGATAALSTPPPEQSGSGGSPTAPRADEDGSTLLWGFSEKTRNALDPAYGVIVIGVLGAALLLGAYTVYIAYHDAPAATRSSSAPGSSARSGRASPESRR